MNIALSGKSGCGKTTIAKYLIDNHGYILCNTGKTCRKICNILFGNESKEILNKVTDAMKSIDENIWFKNAISEIKSNKFIVIDSMRFKSDYFYLKTNGFVLIRVECRHNILLERLSARGQIVNPGEDFKHKSEVDLDDMQFDYIINNNSPVENLYNKLDELLIIQSTAGRN
jgi:dephospho-CoA kinase